MIDLSHLLWPGAGLGLTQPFTQGWFLFTLLLWLAAAGYSLSSQRDDPNRLRYWLFMGLCFAGNLLLIVAQDALTFYLGFSVMSLAGTGLVLHSGTKASRRAGRLYLQLAILGELLLFSALVMRAAAADGVYDWQSWQSIPLDHLTLFLFITGLGLKAGFFPLHLWLPQAHPVAPAAASAVLSGAMIKAGIFGLWLFIPAQDPLLASWADYLVVLGMISACFGALAALCHQAPKVILAYSSVSQVGYLLMLLALSWQSQISSYQATSFILLLYAAHHAFAKGALFLLAGSGAKYRLSAVDWFFVAAFAATLAAWPLTSGALAKHELKQLVTTLSPALTWGLILGSILTAMVLWHFIWQLRQQQLSHDKPIPWGQRLPVVALLTCAVLLPWGGRYLGLFDSLLASVSQIWFSQSLQLVTLSATWGASWPVLIALPLCLLLQRYAQPFLVWCKRQQPWVLWVSLRLKRYYQPR